MDITVSEKDFTAQQTSHNIPREDRPYAWTRNTRMARRHHSGHTGHKRKTYPKIRINTHKTRKRKLQGQQEKVKILLKRNSLAGDTLLPRNE